MVQKRALAPGRAGAGEIERPQPARRDLGADRLDDVGVVLFLVRTIGVASVAMSTAASSSGARQARTADRSIVGRSPWTLTTTS